MRRVGLLLLAVTCALGLAQNAAGVTRLYADARENWSHTLDVTTVEVHDASPGNFVVDVFTPNFQGIQSGDQLTVYLNTDRNPSNNDGGADYALFIEGATPSCGLFRWTGTYVLVRTLSCPVNFGPTFTFSRADVGNPPDFEFYMRSVWTPTGQTDRAPDTGWWLFDPTPPETTITGGPGASTADRNATVSFTSNEAGSSFQCSLDGAAFSACGNPAVYQNLALGTHTFRVRATDPSGNTDASPAAHSWTVIDSTPPTAGITNAICCTAGRATVHYSIADNTGRVAAEITIHKVGKGPSGVCNFGLDDARSYIAPCAVPLAARGWLTACVRAKDAAGLQSARVCRRITFDRLHARAVWRWVPLGGTRVRLTLLRLADLEGGRASLRCRGCRLRGRRGVGTILRRGASIEVRVVKPRIRGSFIRLMNVRGALRQSNACLPPGLPGPVIACRRRS